MTRLILSAVLMQCAGFYSGSFQEIFTSVAKTQLQAVKNELINMSVPKPQPMLSVSSQKQFNPSKTVIRVIKEDRL